MREPAPELLDLDTVFDLASLTKVMLTTRAVMELVDRGALHLDDTLGSLLPGIPAGADHARLTVAQCLGHQTYLPWHEPLFSLGLDRAALHKYVLERDWPHGASVYSDINFILLGFVVEAVTGRPLGAWPLPPGLMPTRPGSAPPPPSRPWRQRLLRGEVHDENAFALGLPPAMPGCSARCPPSCALPPACSTAPPSSPAGLARVRHRCRRRGPWDSSCGYDGWAGGDRASPARSAIPASPAPACGSTSSAASPGSC